MMIVKNLSPRALERLAVIEMQASVREAAALMSKPHTDLVVVCDHGGHGRRSDEDRHRWPDRSLHRGRLHCQD